MTHDDDCPCCAPLLLRYYTLSDDGDVEPGDYFWWQGAGDDD